MFLCVCLCVCVFLKYLMIKTLSEYSVDDTPGTMGEGPNTGKFFQGSRPGYFCCYDGGCFIINYKTLFANFEEQCQAPKYIFCVFFVFFVLILCLFYLCIKNIDVSNIWHISTLKIAKPTHRASKIAKPTPPPSKIAKPTRTPSKIAKLTPTASKIAKPTPTPSKIAKPTPTPSKIELIILKLIVIN